MVLDVILRPVLDLLQSHSAVTVSAPDIAQVV
jgi:hypothetical protein